MALALGLALALIGCRGQKKATAPEELCASPPWQDARRAFIEAMGLPSQRRPPQRPVLGEVTRHQGFTLTALRWPHPEVDGEWVHGLIYTPTVQQGPRPLLLNVHGHWGAGIAADEVNRRAQMFAREGWVVLSIAGRGLELGLDTPVWRHVHFREFLYNQLRSRRSGGTPLGWDVVATWTAVDLATAGMLPASIDRDRIGVMGFSGGAERAAAVAATDPRVGPVVLGAHEYAFSGGHGHAGCSCGVLRGAGDPLPDGEGELRSRWLALAACRPGAPPTPRPVLVWDNEPEDEVDAALLSMRGVTSHTNEHVHGVTGEMAYTSLKWMSKAVGEPVTGAGKISKRAQEDPGYVELQPSAFLPLASSQPAPGQFEQGPPPWRVDSAPRPDVAQALLGLMREGEPMDPGALVLGEETAQVRSWEAREAGGQPFVWLVLADPADLERWGGIEGLRDAAPTARFSWVVPRVVMDEERQVPMVRNALEAGVPPLGVVVQDALDAHRALRSSSGVPAERIGWVGVGGAGVAVLQAALLVGEGSPVAMLGAPTTLFFDGPRSGEKPFEPWPLWTLVAGPGGASLDPWLAARALTTSLRWLDPRGGDAAPFTANLPYGEVREDLPGLLETR